MIVFVLFLDNVDKKALQCLFDEYDVNKDGFISVDELENMLVKWGIAPMADPLKKVSIQEKKGEDGAN